MQSRIHGNHRTVRVALFLTAILRLSRKKPCNGLMRSDGEMPVSSSSLGKRRIAGDPGRTWSLVRAESDAVYIRIPEDGSAGASSPVAAVLNRCPGCLICIRPRTRASLTLPSGAPERKRERERKKDAEKGKKNSASLVVSLSRVYPPCVPESKF